MWGLRKETIQKNQKICLNFKERLSELCKSTSALPKFIDFLCACARKGDLLKLCFLCGPLAAQNRESHDSQNRGPRIARHSAARSKKGAESQESRIAENRFRIAIRIAAYQCLKRPWNRTIRIARFRFARFPIQNRQFSATNFGPSP